MEGELKLSDKEDQQDVLRHSAAHILAAAVKNIWPNAKFGVGPATSDGFYYDIDLSDQKISEVDFEKIELEMSKIIDSGVVFERQEVGIDEAIAWAQENQQPYKLELLNDLKNHGSTDVEILIDNPSNEGIEKVTLYKVGDFVDLCRGPHTETSKNIGAFKLIKIAGAYWRGKEDNPQLQRLYGVVFDNKNQLDEYLKIQEEAKQRDHRKIGEELELFTFSRLVGKGLPLWLEKGTILRRELERFIVDEEIKRGYKHVMTPDIASLELYKTSGHYPYYKDSMYAPIEIDEEQYMLRPMSCPHHFEIYKHKPRSYKDMPLRIAELAKLYRYEKSGELSGLMRVRGFCLADSHIICTKDQAKDEIAGALDLIEYCAELFGLKKNVNYSYRLSLGDRGDESKYYKDDDAWGSSEAILRQVLEDRNDQYVEAHAEAAFYGPKIDIQMKNVLGKEDTAFTVQYDFVMPKRFNLEYMDSDGREQEAVVIHRSSIGAIERMIALLIEFYGGAFPVWLAPEQIRFVTVNQDEEIVKYANSLVEQAQEQGVRAFADTDNESVGKKIRKAEEQKIPYIIVLGQKELETNETTPRIRKDILVQEASSIDIAHLINTVANEAKSRVIHTTL